MQLYPGWSARDNYGYGSKKKKRKKDRSPAELGGTAPIGHPCDPRVVTGACSHTNVLPSDPPYVSVVCAVCPSVLLTTVFVLEKRLSVALVFRQCLLYVRSGPRTLDRRQLQNRFSVTIGQFHLGFKICSICGFIISGGNSRALSILRAVFLARGFRKGPLLVGAVRLHCIFIVPCCPYSGTRSDARSKPSITSWRGGNASFTCNSIPIGRLGLIRKGARRGNENRRQPMEVLPYSPRRPTKRSCLFLSFSLFRHLKKPLALFLSIKKSNPASKAPILKE